MKLKDIYIKALQEAEAPKAPRKDTEEGPGVGDDEFHQRAYDASVNWNKLPSDFVDTPLAPKAPEFDSQNANAAKGLELSRMEKYFATLALKKANAPAVTTSIINKLEQDRPLTGREKTYLVNYLGKYVDGAYRGYLPPSIQTLYNKLGYPGKRF